MVNETELENRTDQQARISEPYGHTAFDRQDNSAFLMVQMRKDIAVVGRAINYALTHMLKLKGIDKILGIKTVTSEFKSSWLALSHLETGCDNILMLSKNKTAMVVLEKRYSDWESRQEELDLLEKFAIAKSKNPKFERSKFFHIVALMIGHRSLKDGSITSIASKEAMLRMFKVLIFLDVMSLTGGLLGKPILTYPLTGLSFSVMVIAMTYVGRMDFMTAGYEPLATTPGGGASGGYGSL